MNKVVLYNNLMDVYEKSLTDNQKDIFTLYYKENLSMQEIAEEKQVSKSFVGKVIKEVENKLTQLEDTFGLLKLKTELSKTLEEKDVSVMKKKIMDLINKI